VQGRGSWRDLAAACVWDLPDLRTVPGLDLDDPEVGDLVCAGADLEPATLARAYSLGLFPMPDPRSRRRSAPPTWWSPVDRGVLPLDGLRVSRSLRRSAGRFEVRVDTAFTAVVEGCADPRREGGWIDRRFVAAYSRLHELGVAHSVETWRDGRLVGGLYGVSLGGLFAGESMFHRERDASKVALLGLVDLLRDEHAQPRLLDVQWATPHLQSLGVVEVPRSAYLKGMLPAALELPEPAWAPRPA
jgi:leucyl/phenylalanyl-tRNA--protein transferase